jgi:GR25 family glycosyltransferase involved in LPS biosynthesis
MSVRVINLTRRTDRLVAITQVLQSHALQWRRQDAVNGAELEWTDLVNRGIVTHEAAERAQLNFPTICRSTGNFSPHLTLEAVACAMSHRALWQECTTYRLRHAPPAA